MLDVAQDHLVHLRGIAERNQEVAIEARDKTFDRSRKYNVETDHRSIGGDQRVEDTADFTGPEGVRQIVERRRAVGFLVDRDDDRMRSAGLYAKPALTDCATKTEYRPKIPRCAAWHRSRCRQRHRTRSAAAANQSRRSTDFRMPRPIRISQKPSGERRLTRLGERVDLEHDAAIIGTCTVGSRPRRGLGLPCQNRRRRRARGRAAGKSSSSRSFGWSSRSMTSLPPPWISTKGLKPYSVRSICSAFDCGDRGGARNTTTPDLAACSVERRSRPPSHGTLSRCTVPPATALSWVPIVALPPMIRSRTQLPEIADDQPLPWP